MFCHACGMHVYVSVHACNINSMYVKCESILSCMCMGAVIRVHSGDSMEPPDNDSSSMGLSVTTAVSCCWLLGFFNGTVGGLRFCQGTGAAFSFKHLCLWDEMLCV